MGLEDSGIAVDAAAKFEAEETGTVSEGAGVTMGGSGVEKSNHDCSWRT
jgi:hypothetical protein